MKLSTKTRYGTRAMVELARANPDGNVCVKDIARRQRLSVKYLEQIMVSLKQAGLVKAARGMHGGYELARPADKIRLSEIFSALEGEPVLVECISGSKKCANEKTCPTRRVWRAMNDVLVNFLDGTTLADMATADAKECDIPSYSI